MRKEAEKILRIIGEDKEFRGGYSVQNAIADYIKGEGPAPGIDQQFYKNHGLLGPSVKAYRKAILELVPFYNQMSYQAFSRFLNFAERLENIDKNVIAAVRDNHTLQSYMDEQVDKRALFLKTLSEELIPVYTLGYLKREKEVRDKHPWMWVDAAMGVDITYAKAEMKSLLLEGRGLNEFCKHAPYLLMEMPGRYVNDIIRSVEGKIPEGQMDVIKQRIARVRKGKARSQLAKSI